MKNRLGPILLLAVIATDLTLTGIITTNDITVSPLIPGQIGQLLVKEGDTVVEEHRL